MENLTDSGVGELAVVFYLLVVAFGSYFILNLILAVIMGSFTKFEKQEIENSMNEAEKKDNLMDSQVMKTHNIINKVRNETKKPSSLTISEFSSVKQSSKE
jgi:hypothetical protein